MTYESRHYGFETMRLDGTFSSGGVFNGIQIAYTTLAGGSFSIGSTITDTTTAATGTIRDIIVDTATTGRLAIEAPTGNFNDTNNLQQGAVTAVQTGSSLSWTDIYTPGGFLEGTTARTRPGTVHSILVEVPWVPAGGGTSNILVINWPDTRLAAGPPVSGNTALALQPTGATTTGSYVVELHVKTPRGLLVRFENIAPSAARIVVVYTPLGRNDFVPRQ